MQGDKFLGIIIHENLSWKPHISVVCDKVSKVIGVLCKARWYLPLDTLKTLYNALLVPYINYCTLIWASTYASYLEPFYVLQKKAIRIITFSPPAQAHIPNPFSLRIIFFHSILFLNSILSVLFFVFCILAMFYLPLFPQSFILIMNITIIWLVHVLIFKLKLNASINLLSPARLLLFGMIFG